MFHSSLLFWLLSSRGKDNPLSGEAAFRGTYGRLGEIRSLLGKNVPFITLTATAKKKTLDTILNDLGMVNCQMVSCTPNKANIRYTVLQVENSLYRTFHWLIEDMHQLGINTPRYLIFCRKKEHASELFEIFSTCLGEKAYHQFQANGCNDDRNRLFGMYHSKTDPEIQDQIGCSLSNADGLIRVLFCTTAFSMGVNAQGVHNVIHYGPSNDTDDYLQETGRVGRDGITSSHAVLLKYKHCLGSKLVSKEMKSYVNNQTHCRRVTLIDEFYEGTVPKQPAHECCDICASHCRCFCTCNETQNCTCDGSCEAELFMSDAEKHLQVEGNAGKTGSGWESELAVHEINFQQKNAFFTALMDYQYSLVRHLSQDKLLTGIDIATGFSVSMIKDITQHMQYITSLDVLRKQISFYSETHLLSTWDILCSILEAESASGEEYGDSDIEVSQHRVQVLTSSSEDETV